MRIYKPTFGEMLGVYWCISWHALLGLLRKPMMIVLGLLSGLTPVHMYYYGVSRSNVVHMLVCILGYMAFDQIAVYTYIPDAWFSKCLTRHDYPKALGKTFSSMQITPTKADIEAYQGHSHPISAATRRKFYELTDQLLSVVETGVVGVLQPASRDKRTYRSRSGDVHTVEYSMDYHWPVDWRLKPGEYSGTPDYELIVDTDYYVDVKKYLAKPRVVLLYTLQPSTLAEDNAEYSYRFNLDNRLEYRIHDTGDVFVHRVYNWRSGTYFLAHDGWNMTLYRVHVRNMGMSRAAVMLIPEVSMGIPEIVLFHKKMDEFKLNGAMVKKFKPIQSNGEKAFGVLYGPQDVTISIVDFTRKCSIPWKFSNEAIAKAYAVAKRSNATASSLVGIAGSQDGACVLYDYIRAFDLEEHNSIFDEVHIGQGGVVNYTLTQVQHLDPRVPGQELPIVTPLKACVPEMGEAGANSAVDRLVEGRAISKEADATNYTPYALEFAELLLAGKEKLTPLSPLEVEEQLNLPKHKKERNTYMPQYLETADPRATLFPKNESYPKIASNRPIINYSTEFKHAHSAYMGAVARLLKGTSWYGFGLSPRALVDRVVTFATSAGEYILETDFSKFDGTVGEMRKLEAVVINSLFKEPKSCYAIWRKQLGNKVTLKDFKTKWGEYITNGERQSGSPETSVFNSIDNALISYIALREQGNGPRDAWNKLGIYGGDDGITAHVTVNNLESVAKQVGTQLKVKVVKSGCPFSFLGRYFNAWAGDNDSCYDPVRFYSKLSYGEDKSLKPHEMLARKLAALTITDPHTPWVVDAKLKYEEVYGVLPEYDAQWQMSWWTSQTLEAKENFYVGDIVPDWFMDLLDGPVNEARSEFEKSLSKAASINGIPTGQGKLRFSKTYIKPTALNQTCNDTPITDDRNKGREVDEYLDDLLKELSKPPLHVMLDEKFIASLGPAPEPPTQLKIVRKVKAGGQLAP